MHGRTTPSLQTIINLNEIVELVVLKEKLLMPTTDHILILKNLNYKKIQELGGNEVINWEYEIRNLGKDNLDKPIITNSLYEAGALVLDTEQNEDEEFRKFGEQLYTQQWSGDWLVKAVGLQVSDRLVKDLFEREYIRGLNNFITSSQDPVFLKMFILAAPDLISSHPHLKETKYDYSWMYRFYKEVEIYARFAKKKNTGFSDTSFVQPFVAFNFQHSDSFVDIFYSKLKEVRNAQIRQFLELQHPWLYHLPPLTAILLQRCKTLEDLSSELIKLRNEFSNLRDSLTKYQKQYEEADTIREKIELQREFQNSIHLFMRKVTGGRKRIVKTILDFTFDQSDSVIRQDFSGPIKAIVGRVIDYVYHRRLYPWMNSFLDMYDRSLALQSDINIYEKMFGEINLDHLGELELFAKNSAKLLSIHTQ